MHKDAQVKLTLIQAALETGKDRSTLFRAIKKGKLSGEIQEDKSYLIDSSELFRVYPPKSRNDATHKHATVALQHDAQGELINVLRAQIDLLKDQVNREREQTDHWRKQATMLLTHQPEKQQEVKQDRKEDSPLWQKLFGRR